MANGDVYISIQADTGPLEADFARARAEVRGLQAELNKVGVEMRKTGAAMDSELGQHSIQLGRELSAAKGQFAQLNETIKAHKAAVEGAGEEVQGLLAHFRQFVEGVQGYREAFSSAARFYVEAFAVHEIAEWIDSVAEAGEHIERLSAQLGASTTEVQQLGGIAKLTGTDLDSMAEQLGHMELRLREAAGASNPLRAALAAAGIEANKFAALPLSEKLGQLSQLYHTHADGVAKTAFSYAVLGRAGGEMIPWLDRGKDGVKELNEVIERTGVVMSKDMVEGFAQTKERISEFSLAMKGLSEHVFAAFKPDIDGAVRILSDLAESLTKSATNGGLLTAALDLVKATFGGLEIVISVAIATFEDLWNAADAAIRSMTIGIAAFGKSTGMVFEDIGAGAGKFFAALEAAASETTKSIGRQFADLGAAISDGLHGNFAAAGADLAKINADSKTTGDAIAASFKGIFDFSDVGAETKKATEEVAKIWADFRKNEAAINKSAQSEIDAIAGRGGAKGGGPPAGAPPFPDFTTARGGKGGAGKGAAQEAREAYQTEVDAARNAAAATLDTLDNEVRQHKISWDRWAKDSTAALETEKAAIEAAANAAMKSAALTSIEKQRIANQEARAITEINKREADEAAKAAEETQRAWDNFFKPFNTSIEQMVSGVVSGHERIGQAVAKTLESMIADVLKYFTQWTLHQAELVAAHVAGNSVIEASDQAANLFGLGQLLANAARAVAVDAGVAAAGVTANQAPILGPAAIGEGLAVGGSVAGFVSAFDIGAWEVPHNQLAMVHQSELVMPAGPAARFRDMLESPASGQGPGGDVHIHPTVHVNMGGALDGASVSSWMRHNGPGMVKAIDEAVRHGAALGAKRLR